MKLSLSDQAKEATAGASEVLERLRAAFTLSARNNSELVFYTRSRVKNPNSLIAKLFDRQQRYDDISYNLTDVTDIVGYRIVVLYDDLISDALTLTLNVLENCYFTEDKLIDEKSVLSAIHEVKFFPRRNRDSDPYKELFDQYKNAYPHLVGKKIKIQDAAKTDYSSMHIIVYMNSYSQGYIKKIPVEIQIRTAIEDVWSEISHKNKYKVRRPNVWTPQIELHYTDNERTVNIIKEHLDAGIPDQINDVRKTTKSIRHAIEELRSTNISGYDSTALNFIHLLCAGKADINLRKSLDAYNEAIRKARPRRTGENFKKLIHFVDEISLCSEKLEDSATKSNITLLLDFERLRLEAISLKESYQSRPKKMTDEQWRTELETIRHDAMRVYSGLDELQRNNDLKLKPVSLLEFWKFYISRYTNLEGHYLTHLLACASSMPVDPTIDSAHVLKYMVPRLLAYESWLSAEKHRENIGDMKTIPPNISQSIRSGYSEALKSALESRKYLHGTTMKNSKDDLNYYRSGWEKYICLNNVIQYATDCITKGVGEFYFSEIGYSLDEFKADIDALEKVSSKIRKHHMVQISHTRMIALNAIDQIGPAKKIANAFKRSKINNTNWDDLGARVKEDVISILK